MKIKESQLREMIRQSLSSKEFQDRTKYPSDGTFTDDEYDFYSKYGNKSQYPLDGGGWGMPQKPGELAMDALQNEDPDAIDPDLLDLTPSRGNDPEWWKSKKITESQLRKIISETIKKSLKENSDMKYKQIHFLTNSKISVSFDNIHINYFKVLEGGFYNGYNNVETIYLKINTDRNDIEYINIYDDDCKDFLNKKWVSCEIIAGNGGRRYGTVHLIRTTA